MLDLDSECPLLLFKLVEAAFLLLLLNKSLLLRGATTAFGLALVVDVGPVPTSLLFSSLLLFLKFLVISLILSKVPAVLLLSSALSAARDRLDPDKLLLEPLRRSKTLLLAEPEVMDEVVALRSFVELRVAPLR